MIRRAAILTVFVAAGLAAGCEEGDDEDALVLYSGRSESLVGPLVEEFERSTEIEVSVRYGGTSELAMALMEEGDASRADLFWGQDAGALGALEADDLLTELSPDLGGERAEAFRSEAEAWVPTSGRARVFAYSSERVEGGELPEAVDDLAGPAWEGRVGWAPTNASFQAFVTAMIAERGRAETKSWLTDLRDNGAESFANNSALLQAIGSGEIDAALTNHYYLYRFKADDPDFPVEQIAFEDGDIGNLLNVAGLGVVASSERAEEAERFIEAMLSDENQRFFAEEVYEYPVIELELEREGAAGAARDRDPEALGRARPDVALREMADLDASLDLLRDVELL